VIYDSTNDAAHGQQQATVNFSIQNVPKI